MKKVIKLNESDIQRIVKRVLTEQFELTKEEEKIVEKWNSREKIEPSDIPSDAHQDLKNCIKKYNRLLEWYQSASSEQDRQDRNYEITGLDCMYELSIGL